jgi:hypothetical protein
MKTGWMMALAIGLGIATTACSEKLENTTWKGNYEKDSVTFDFQAGNAVKVTWSKGFREKPTNTSSDMTYSVDGKTVLFKNANDKVTAKAQLENGDMVGRPVDFGFEDLDSTARVVVKRVK